MRICILVISLSLLLMGCLAKPSGPGKVEVLEIPKSTKTIVENTPEPTVTLVTPTLVPVPTPIIIIVTPTPIPTSEVLPLPTPTLVPTPTLLPGTVPPTIVPTPTSVIPTPTLIPIAIPTPTPKYQSVLSEQVAGIPDLLDFTSGPTITGTTLDFSATYFERGLGTPTVVQLWQRNGLAEAVISDAKDNDCSTQGPVAFLREPPQRGMKYSESEVKAYPWKYCLNTYIYNQTSDIPWINATSWTYNIDGVLETFTFSADISGAAIRFDNPGNYVLIIFAGGRILSEKVVP